MIGTLQALEVIKVILDLPTINGRLLVFDGLSMTFRTVKLRGRVEGCCEGRQVNPHEFDYQEFTHANPCSLSTQHKFDSLPESAKTSVEAYLEQASTADHILLDVRVKS
jgi:hypothetical protein